MGAVSIDGPVDDTGEPYVLIDASGLEGQVCGLSMKNVRPSSIRNLVVTGASVGVSIDGTAACDMSNCVLRGNHVGLGVAASDCVIDGLLAYGNTLIAVVVHNVDGFQLKNSRIGCDRSGSAAMSNRQGVAVYKARSCCIGPGNVISGNELYGVVLGVRSRDCRVIGNFIGCDVTGMKAIPNGRSGLLIFHASDNVVGGAEPGDRNVISGNTRNGINIDSSALRPNDYIPEAYPLPMERSPSERNRIIGNYIGVDATGAGPLPNLLNGVILFMCQSNIVGGTGPGEGNVISANKRFGILVTGPNPDTPDWRIYVRDTKTGEFIKTVEEDKLEPLDQQVGNAILGNIIGTDAKVEKAMSNDSSGIGIFFMPNTRIGEPGPHGGNTVSGNRLHGVIVTGAEATGTSITNNRIGLAGPSGVSLQNGGIGILFREVPDALNGSVIASEGNLLPYDRRAVVIRSAEDEAA